MSINIVNHDNVKCTSIFPVYSNFTTELDNMFPKPAYFFTLDGYLFKYGEPNYIQKCILDRSFALCDDQQEIINLCVQTAIGTDYKLVEYQSHTPNSSGSAKNHKVDYLLLLLAFCLFIATL